MLYRLIKVSLATMAKAAPKGKLNQVQKIVIITVTNHLIKKKKRMIQTSKKFNHMSHW